MTFSVYDLSVPVFTRGLNNLKGILKSGEDYAVRRKIDPPVLLNSRLFPDMFPLTRQVQLVSDFAKGGAARLAGIEVPQYEDNEKTFAELDARLTRTLDFLGTVNRGAIDKGADREITMTIAGNPITLQGRVYLVERTLPNFWFHMSIAYAILRHNGVEIGKKDFILGPNS